MSLRAAAAIMTRVPSRSDGKSRLKAVLEPTDRRDLQLAMLLDALSTVQSVEKVDSFVAYHPAEGKGELEELLGQPASLLFQRGEDLGERLRHVAGELARAYEAVILLAADSPALRPSHLRKALATLERFEVCIGPAADGGYYLLAFRGEPCSLFQAVDWSTGQVLSQTIRNIRREGRTFRLLDALPDVDTASDLRRLQGDLRTLRSRPDGRSRHTSELLRKLEDKGVLRCGA